MQKQPPRDVCFKFAAYFQSTFSYEQLWMAASEYSITPVIIPIIPIQIFYYRCFEEAMRRSPCNTISL